MRYVRTSSNLMSEIGHLCPKSNISFVDCGHMRKWEEVWDQELSSGIVRFPKCSIVGLLN